MIGIVFLLSYSGTYVVAESADWRDYGVYRARSVQSHDAVRPNL